MSKIGSAPEGRNLDFYHCANNNSAQRSWCAKKGILRCGQCCLVGYCSPSCQKEHWNIHKKRCHHSKFLSGVWQPNWEKEGHFPKFSTQAFYQETFGSGSGVRLWGSTPAIDVIGWERNEYKENSNWPKPMKIEFTASADFRSTVETLASVPESSEEPITIILNDINPAVVTRNLLMLGLLMARDEEALDTVIAIWYSSAMTENQYMSCTSFINDHLRPLSLNKEDKPQLLQCEGTDIELNQLGDALRDIVKMIKISLDMQSFINARNNVMLAPSRKDYIDRHLLGMKEYHRESTGRFRTYGLLLPFECLTVHHNVPNKFFFHPLFGYLLNDDDDPLEGWDMLKVMEFGDSKNLPKNDLYGRLFFYIHDRLSKMVSTIERVPITFRLFQKDARILATDFQRKGIKFDRIDVSNISDENYIDIDAVLNGWGPLLNKDNQNSAIVTLFLNWYPMFTGGDELPTRDLLMKAAAMVGNERFNKYDPLVSQEKFLVKNAILSLTDQSDVCI